MRKFTYLILLVLLGACSMPLKSLLKPNATSISMPGSKEKIPIIEWKKVPLEEYSIEIPQKTTGAPPVALKDIAYLPKSKFLQAGDIIEVTVFDAGEDGLFSSVNSKELKLGRATIDRNGAVTLPFVNRISAKNMTAEAMQKKIQQGLKGYTINPQVVLTVVSRASNNVTVSGGVKNPGRFALEAGRERILDILALAGGANAQNNLVTLIREKQQASALLKTIIEDNEQNVLLQSDDQLILSSDETAKFTALGAFKAPGEYAFEPGKLSLGQAITRAGGAQNGATPVSNIYIFRVSLPKPVVDPALAPPPSTEKEVPQTVAYHIDTSEVSAFISMQSFYLRDGDKLFATEKPISKW